LAKSAFNSKITNCNYHAVRILYRNLHGLKPAQTLHIDSNLSWCKAVDVYALSHWL